MTLEERMGILKKSSHYLISPNSIVKNCFQIYARICSCYWVLYHIRFQEGCIDLLTSITSMKVRWHLLYTLLTYYVVLLGSMGTGEDLFYKCWAPSEELSTHGYFTKKSHWNLNYYHESSFLDWKTIYTLYISFLLSQTGIQYNVPVMVIWVR